MQRVGAGAAAVLVLVVAGAGPAGAEPQRTMSLDPTDDVTVSPTASGSFKGASLVVNVEKITAVDLKVSPTGPTGGSPVTQNGCEVATAGACNTGAITFEWAMPALAYNGPYVVEASGRFCDPLLCLNPTSASVDPIEFRLGAEPKAPADLRTEGGDDRSVVVSWARNGEPDMLYYALFRKDPGGDFRRIGNDIKQPGPGRASFTDTSVAGTNGGDFAYKVFAVRKGLSGDEKTTKISKGSSERTMTVTPPPTTTTPGDQPGGGPVSTVAGDGVDISSFLSGQAPTLPSPSPIFLDLPDTGFGETLPFGQLPGEAEPGEEDAVLPTTPRQRAAAELRRNRPLIPIAAGLILMVMAAHVRLLNVRTRPEAAPKKLPPGTYVARALEAARSPQPANGHPANGYRPTVIPIDPSPGDPGDPIPVDPLPLYVAAAVANGGHHRMAPPADDLAGLPVWAEFEPVSALGLLDEPEPARKVRNGSHDREFELFAPDIPAEAPPSASTPPPVSAPVPPPASATAALDPYHRSEIVPLPVKVAAGPVPSHVLPPYRPSEEPEPFFQPDAAFDAPGVDAAGVDAAEDAAEPEREPEPEADPALVYAFDGEQEWSAEPEVFVSPRT